MKLKKALKTMRKKLGKAAGELERTMKYFARHKPPFLFEEIVREKFRYRQQEKAGGISAETCRKLLNASNGIRK